MSKMVPHWGYSPQPGSTYYLQKLSHDILGIVNHSNDQSAIYGPFYGKKALRVKRALSNIAKDDVMGKKIRIFVNTCARMLGPCAFSRSQFRGLNVN